MSTITDTRITAAQNGDADAAEFILSELDGAAKALSWGRVKGLPVDAGAFRDDLTQTARVAFWCALQDWDVQADNAASFESYAFQRAKLDVAAATFAELAPGVNATEAGRYAAALGRNDGDHDQAAAELQAKGRMSLSLAGEYRDALAGSERIDADPDAYKTMAGADSAATSADRWAETQGELPDHMLYPLDLSRDAVRCKGVRTTGKGAQKGVKRRDRVNHDQPIGQGKGASWKEAGALVDRAADADMAERSTAVGEVIAERVRAVLTETERETVALAYGECFAVNEGSGKGTPDLCAVAERMGKTRNTVSVTLKRARTKLRKAREAGEI
ncbi:hypothetical protein ABT160_23665 [Streptomyces sp. NPDC001941]|uniref:hypothetical protein n=1 Tax=Streptomyces sp. NPDC001941 TaxID=3154659 RepID=UPI0033266CDC